MGAVVIEGGQVATPEVAAPAAAPAGPDLSGLRAEALQDGQAAPPSPAEKSADQARQVEREAERAGNAMMIRGGLAWAVSRGEAAYPGMAKVWPEPVQGAVSERAAAVMAKYNIAMPDWLARFENEIALALLLLPLLAQTAAIIKSGNEARARQARNAQAMVPANDDAPPAAVDEGPRGKVIRFGAQPAANDEAPAE